MSSACPSDDLLMVRMTGLVAGAGVGTGISVESLGTSIGNGLIALRMLGWSVVVLGLPAAGSVAVPAVAGLVVGLALVDWIVFGVVLFVADSLAVSDLAKADLLDAEPACFGVAGAGLLATKYSCALKTFKQEPQRTEPLADCS